ncbi:MAG: hypothetical protein EBZ48_15390 [Proteobacteria bacterium]|nr:hypothetical protein [Pseudomonadota bacterium]
MVSLLKFLITSLATFSLLGCMTPTTALQIGGAKSEVHRLQTGKPALNYSLANTNGLTKEQISAKEAELYAKVQPAIQKYENGWTSDFAKAAAQIQETGDVAPFIELEAKTRAYDAELSASLSSVGLKGTNSILFPNGKAISRVEFVRELASVTERGITAGRKGAQEINNSRDFAANTAKASVLLLGAVAVAGAQNPIPQPSYPVAGQVIPSSGPTTTYINPVTQTATSYGPGGSSTTYFNPVTRTATTYNH